MSSGQLELLIGHLADPEPRIRLYIAENLVPFSDTAPAAFKTRGLKPVKDLKLLAGDSPEIAKHALDMLINLSADPDVLEELAADDPFLELVFHRIVDPDEPNANLLAMLLANLAKSEALTTSLLRRKQSPPPALASDHLVLNQLLDLFVKGQDGSYNKAADYDYLAYVLADLARHADIRRFLVTAQAYDDGAVPLTKLKVFTEHVSAVRRKGVASTIRNVAFDVAAHPNLLSDAAIDLLPYVLLPITGPEEYDPDDDLAMLPDLQLLSPDKRRDPDCSIVQTHVETLTLFATTKHGRDLMRDVRVYPIIREMHLHVDDEGVREACERLVQLLMRDEEPESQPDTKPRLREIEPDEDDLIFEV